jgi:hypothetical protein
MNPYHIGMLFGLERVARHLGPTDHQLHVVCEKRGKEEDADLELAFLRTCADSALVKKTPMSIVFANKGNFSGLEIADLVSRPIGRHVMNPAQPNSAYEIIEKKFWRSPAGKIDGWGLKCFP